MIKSLSKKPSFALAAMAVAVATAAPSAFSQEEIEEVVVTGSRIPVNTNTISSVPVQSVTEEDIRNSGEINIADIVSDIPALVSSLTAENSLTGANSLNLRGLGGDRSLTLVNGRRHVAGFRGSQAVDVGTIPRALVKSVEVTTGGASAIYGADAVTGVVNFILKDDFEGFQVDLSGGVPERGGAQTTTLDLVWGSNFANGRGNAVVTFSSEMDEGLRFRDRSWSRDNGIAETLVNPDPNGPPRAVVQDPRFWLTSQEGSIAPGFGGRSDIYVDINGNGIADCQESEGGRVGYLAGCWLVGPDGTVRVNQDGVVVDGLWGTGGDGGRVNFNRDTLFPETDRQVVNFNVNYEFADNLRGFLETKYVRAETTVFNEQDTFYDTLEIRADNAFIPDALQPVVDQTGYLLLTQDPLDLSDNNNQKYTRETSRFVAGLEWEPADGHSVEVSFNRGMFQQTDKTNAIYLDRFYSAIDSVVDSSGNVVCRSTLDPTTDYPLDYFAGSNGFADGDYYSDRYYSFTPGDGQCQPLNPFGTYSASEAAQNFVTADLESTLKIQQWVFNVTAVGQFEVLQSVLDGPVGYAAGVERREESSDNRLDPLTLGVIPEGSPYEAGQSVNSISPWLYSFISFDNTQQYDTKGDYDVTDVFAEVRLPIFLDRDFTRELTLDAAVRQADYSTSGKANTWKVGVTWAPIDDIRFRGTVSEAVRAPNISELFDPRLPITVAASSDPCASTNINNGTDAREANCVAALTAIGVSQDAIFTDGVYDWTNPLTARFNGVSGGNPALDVETADTTTYGVVIVPSFAPGLTLSVDYWDVAIDQAIAAASSDDILKGCYDSSNYPSLDFCNAFTRRGDGGLNFLETGTINFAKLEAEGVDVSASYDWAMGENDFRVSLVGSRQKRLDRFFNPLDTSDVDPELQELQRPRVTGSLSLSWDRGPWSAGIQNVYQGKQAVDEIEEVLGLGDNQAVYGDDGFFDSIVITDINGSYQYSDELTIYGAVNNVTDEEPWSTQNAWPVGPRGRTFVLGVSYSM